jgi:uncharacterized membrane protein YedE/YeeE
MLGVLNIGLFNYAEPWSTYSGLRLWGYTILDAMGLHYFGVLPSPFQDPISVIDVGLLLGAFAAAHLAKEFAFRSTTRREYLKGLSGGLMMGIGASLAQGCTVGGFLSPVSSLALAGFLMMAGLVAGAYIGAKALLWEVSKHPPKILPKRPREVKIAYNYRAMPYVGLFLTVVAVLMIYSYSTIGFTTPGGFLAFGFLIGVVLQRSKWCLASAFREPFLSGDARFARAGFITAFIGLVGFTWLKVTGIKPDYIFVTPADTAVVVGGVVFGFGMVMAGGCASGTLWRVGEGQLKLWVALLGFMLGSGVLPNLLGTGGYGSITAGPRIFLPSWLGMGYGAAFLLAFGLLALWLVLVTFNQARRQSKSFGSVLLGRLLSAKAGPQGERGGRTAA